MTPKNNPRSAEEFSAEQQLLLERWPDGHPKCPKCFCTKVYDCRRKDGHPRWKCKACRKEFSLTSGTPWAFHKKPHTEIVAPAKMMFYPFMPKKNAANGSDLVLEINSAVPRTLPSEIRADVCQEMAVAVLSGEISRNDIKHHVEVFIRKVKDLSGFIEYALSLDAPAPGSGATSFDSGAQSFYEAAMARELRVEADEVVWSGEDEDDDLPDIRLWCIAA